MIGRIAHKGPTLLSPTLSATGIGMEQIEQEATGTPIDHAHPEHTEHTTGDRQGTAEHTEHTEHTRGTTLADAASRDDDEDAVAAFDRLLGASAAIVAAAKGANTAAEKKALAETRVTEKCAAEKLAAENAAVAEKLAAEKEKLAAERETLAAENTALAEKLAAENAAFQEELAKAAAAEKMKLAAEREKLAAENTALADKLAAENAAFQEEFAKAAAEKIAIEKTVTAEASAKAVAAQQAALADAPPDLRSALQYWASPGSPPKPGQLSFNENQLALDGTSGDVYRANTMWRKLLHSGFETCFGPSVPKVLGPKHVSNPDFAPLKQKGSDARI